jgi:putative SOS response-associated peptidase YedK
MCGRFTLSKPEKIPTRFHTAKKLPLIEASYNIAPSQTLPTIVRKSPNRVVMMRWGFVWNKDSKYGTINIRSETTKEKPFFRKFLLTSRCIVPSDGFYEWRTVNLEGKEEKYPFFICLKERKMFGFAGIYNKLADAEGRPQFYFAILTCSPNSKVKEVHHRMPVILGKKSENEWLDPETRDFDRLYSLLKPYPEGEMKLHPVSKRVNSPRNDDEDLIKPFEELKLL